MRFWHQPRSLMLRLTLGFVLVTAVGVVVADVCLAWVLNSQLQSRTDTRLRHVRPEALSGVEEGRPPPAQQANCLILLLDARGHVQRRTAGVRAGSTPLALSLGTLREYAASDNPHTMGDGQYRGFVDRLPDGRFLVTAIALTDDLDIQRSILAVEGLISVPLIGAVVLGSAWFSRRTLAPMRQITQAAQDIAGGDSGLSHRVEVTPAHAHEAVRMSGAFNSMLERIEREFTRRRKAEDELRDFVAAVSHELRTPLTAISGYAQLARFGALDTPVLLDDAMERVQKEACRMASLVEELLLLARLEQGRPLELHPLDLAELCQEAVADARVAAPGHPLVYEADAGPYGFRGDPNRLRQVITNLLANVAAHTPRGSVGTLRLTRAPDAYVIDVVDEGSGIPAELRERVFERFFRVGRVRHAADETAPSQGSGLGLSIVAAIVRAHHGTVEIRPSERGTWLRVELPAPRRSPGESAEHALRKL